MDEKLMDETGRTIKCLSFAVNDKLFVLPQSVVAEVIRNPNWSEEEAVSGEIGGALEWRENTVPVLFMDDPSKSGDRIARRAIVLCALSEESKFPFYAFRIDGAPRPVEFDEETLREGTVDQAHSDRIACRFTLAGQEFSIPNLTVIEQGLVGLSL